MLFQPFLTGEKPYDIRLLDLFQFPTHWHSELEILYCKKGSFTTEIDGKKYIVRQNEAVFVGSMVEHAYYNFSADTVVLLIELGPVFLGSDFKSVSAVSFNTPVIPVINTPFGGIFTEVSDLCTMSDSAKNLLLMKSLLYRLLSLIMDAFPQNPIGVEIKRKRMSAMLKVQKAIEYIYDNYQNPITLKDVAKITGYEASNFCTYFKMATHMSFHKYLNTYRINIACMLLTETSDSVAAIGEKCGIPCTKSFCRIFRQVTGFTPTEYRKSSLKAAIYQNNIDKKAKKVQS